MKKGISFLAVTMMLFVTTQSFAQLRFGARAGLNLANMSGGGFAGTTPKMVPSFHVGGVVEYSLSDAFCLESGLMISGKGTSMEMSSSGGGATITGKSKITPLYLEIPINALYKIEMGSAKLQLFAGPYFAFGVAGKITTDYTATGLPAGVTLASLGLDNTSASIKYGSDAASDMKSMDLGLNFGAGVEISNFQIRLQYGLGLANIEATGTSGSEIKNSCIGIGVGYMFGGN